MLKTVTNKLGLDKSIAFTSLSKILQGLGGVVSLLLIAKYFTGVEQGFYYTFASILAVQVFFELGLNGIIIQFVAHEAVHLKQINNKYTGNQSHLSRLAYLLRFCIKWYSILAIGLFVLLTCVGFIFFTSFYKSQEYVNWQWPWVLISITTTLYFIFTPIVCFIEGLGKIKQVAFIRLIQQLVNMIALWAALAAGAKLYAAGIAMSLAIIILVVLTYKQFSPILKSILKVAITDKVSYRREIFPYQWKIAVSWMSGYMIFNMFNPIVFAFAGPVAAGKMGMTLSLLNSIQSLTFSWISTKIPLMSGLVAKKEFDKLDNIFNKTLKIVIVLTITGVILLFSAMYVIDYFNIPINGKPLFDKILGYYPTLMMSAGVIISQYVGAIGIYLRSHKKEPLLYYSLTMATLCVASIFVGVKFFGVNGVATGYAIVNLVTMPMVYHIYRNCKTEWHLK